MKRVLTVAAKVAFTAIACISLAWWLYGPRSH